MLSSGCGTIAGVQEVERWLCVAELCIVLLQLCTAVTGDVSLRPACMCSQSMPTPDAVKDRLEGALACDAALCGAGCRGAVEGLQPSALAVREPSQHLSSG